ncbi:helix-turn-helix transcriptional regulator [Vibrio sp. SCSIO 43140]|uniref:helix-turn-helix domain-containing protein n=1 Tax=Vibrio sp. SCSIO 43140 TaxID=2819100 RepID=UPI00207654F4|nr:helix-turn-helix transcriptional regulator [Vibrio sp. SCSIO 43140]USD61303.1 helix-turn-helix transcriptional regulator [Vibrio sp. SCSIO 43140]
MLHLTKNDLILWVTHAIAHFESLGKKQKDLALALGIKETRLSEMKTGKGTLSPNLIERITELCGAPRRNPGRFEYAELYPDLDTFFSSLLPVTENRFYRKILTMLSNSDYLDAIINHCSSNEADDLETPVSREQTIDNINSLITNKEFQSVCVNYQKHLLDSGLSRAFKWANTAKQGWNSKDKLTIENVTISDERIFHSLYLAWRLKQYVIEYEFGSERSININPTKDRTSIVMTGDRILTLQSESSANYPINKEIEKILGSASSYKNIYSSHSPFGEQPIFSPRKLEPKPDWWSDIRCEVYLSENMNYHFLIHMTAETMEFEDQNILEYPTDLNDREPIVHPNDRIAIITNISSLELYRHVEELRKWVGMPSDNLYKLKQKIAKAGGYVPEAIVLL